MILASYYTETLTSTQLSITCNTRVIYWNPFKVCLSQQAKSLISSRSQLIYDYLFPFLSFLLLLLGCLVGTAYALIKLSIYERYWFLQVMEIIILNTQHTAMLVCYIHTQAHKIYTKHSPAKTKRHTSEIALFSITENYLK